MRYSGEMKRSGGQERSSRRRKKGGKKTGTIQTQVLELAGLALPSAVRDLVTALSLMLCRIPLPAEEKAGKLDANASEDLPPGGREEPTCLLQAALITDPETHSLNSSMYSLNMPCSTYWFF